MTSQNRHSLPGKQQLTLMLMLAVFACSLCINLFSQPLATTILPDDASGNIAALAMDVAKDAEDPLDMLALCSDLSYARPQPSRYKTHLHTPPYFAPVIGASPRAPPVA